MRIGILTFQWAINYGAVLQMYALKTYLEKIGHKVLIVNFQPQELKELYSLNLFSKGLSWKGRLFRIINNYLKKEQYKKFNMFLSDNFILSEPVDSLDKLNDSIKTLDIIISGSDQVWNKNITGKYLKDYLLYDIDCIKISYAASIGNKTLSEKDIELFKNSLEKFSKISVREEFTKEQLEKVISSKPIEDVLDPVFLLSKEEWLNQFKTKYENNNIKYILIYMLEYNQSIVNAAEKLSIKTGLPIYSIEIPYFRRFSNTIKINKLHDIGPHEFIYLISNAEYILTNSFHGTAFSLIFEKMFIPFVHSSGNLRLENILRMYGLKDNQIDKSDPDIEEIQHKLEESSNAYKQINIISDYIENSKNFLLYL